MSDEQDEILQAIGGETFLRDVDGKLALVNRVEIKQGETDTNVTYLVPDKIMASVGGVAAVETEEELDDPNQPMETIGMIIAVKGDQSLFIALDKKRFFDVWAGMTASMYKPEVVADIQTAINAHGWPFRDHGI